MEIIIAGCGKVGFSTAKSLSEDKDINITIIDVNTEALDKASEALDVMLVKGSALSESALSEAGVKDADLVICVTGSDEVNILCAICAKQLGAKRAIARVRDPEYSSDFNRIWKSLGIDMTINPEHQTAREISRLLRYPPGSDVITFIGGRIEITTVRVSDSPETFLGQSVYHVFRKNKGKVILAAVQRGDRALVPYGELVFEAEDVIWILGRPSNIMDFLADAGKKPEKTSEITIIGGSKITRYLVELLGRHASKTKIRIIEKDREKCEDLSENYPRCLIIHGDGTDEGIISSEEVTLSNAVVCLTNRDEENIIISLYSIRNGIRKVISKVNYINRNIVRSLNVGSIVNPQSITADRIAGYVRGARKAPGSGIKTMDKMLECGDGGIAAMEFIVSSGSKLTDIPIKDLRLKSDVLIGCIVKGEKIIIPTGESVIQPGDTVIIIAKDEIITELDDIAASGR